MSGTSDGHDRKLKRRSLLAILLGCILVSTALGLMLYSQSGSSHGPATITVVVTGVPKPYTVTISLVSPAQGGGYEVKQQLATIRGS